MTQELFISVIICTVNRAKWVNQVLASLSSQVRLPDEVIIVDASTQEMAYELPHNMSIRVLKSQKGLTRQRNVGIDMARGNVLVFLDDDVILDPECLKKIVDVFSQDTGKDIGGVGAFIRNQWGVNTEKSRWIRRLARIVGIYDGSYCPGTVSPSGIFDELNGLKPFTGIRYVDFLPGCGMAYRVEVLEKFRPPLEVTQYGGEDKCLSRMIANDWRLCICGDAKLEHFACEGGPRPSELSSYRSTVRNNLFIQRKYGKTDGGQFRLRLYYIYSALFSLCTGLIQMAFFSKRKKGYQKLSRAIGYLLGALGRV